MGRTTISIKDFLKNNDYLKIYLTGNIFVCICEEDSELIIELSADEDYLTKTNIEHLVNINFDTDVFKVKQIITHDVLNRYILEHL